MDLKKILGGALGVMGGPIGAIGGSLLSAYLENKASRKMQQAEQDYQQQPLLRLEELLYKQLKKQ